MIDTRSPQSESGDLSRAEALGQWLGIEQPDPTYYELLHLPNMAADRRAIFEAGREAKRKLRPYQIGRYRRLALEILADVGQAVSTLTNAQKKNRYDSQLIRRWQNRIEILWEEHGKSGPRMAGALEAWLGACADEGIPVVLLLPWMIRYLRRRTGAWPPHGIHHLDLPAGLWVYRDLVILGRCLSGEEDMAERGRLVQEVQRALSIPEGLARLVATEISRRPEALEELRLIRQARREPARTVERLARRMNRMDARFDETSPILRAAAQLTGAPPETVDRVLERLDEPPVERQPITEMSQATREIRKRAAERGQAASEWVAARPQLLLAVALALGLAALAISLLVAFGVLPLGGSAPPPPASRQETRRPEDDRRPERPADTSPGPREPANVDAKENAEPQDDVWAPYRQRWGAGGSEDDGD